jgi:hypothetical protein
MSTEIPADATFTNNEYHALFEIKAAIRDLTVLGKMIDESLANLSKAMESLARRKKIKISVKDYQVMNLDAITLSFS